MRERFTSLEAWLYESFIAAGVIDGVAPVIEQAVIGQLVLDVGSGGGLLAERLRRRGHVVVSVDLSAAQARRARGIQASAMALPFRDATFDTVVSSCSIKHWADASAGVAECRRVLRPGGSLVVVEMDRESTADEVRRFVAMTRVPRPFRRLHAQLDLRSVLPWALSVDELGDLVGSPAAKVEGLPYAFVVDHV